MASSDQTREPRSLRVGDLTPAESHRLWNEIIPRAQHYNPIHWDWDQWEERWCLGFDASRHAIPYQHPLPFPGHDIDADGNRLPELPEWQKLSALEFEVFERCFYVSPTDTLGEVVQLLRINHPALAAVQERVQIKLSSIFEQE